MSFFQLCLQRRSCRKYAPESVRREVLERCLEAARLAPSACNSQPWRLVVVDTPEIKNALADAAFSGVYRMNAFAKQAPVLVVVIREKSRYAALLAGALRGVPYSLIDLGIVGEHFILQAAEEGLGTCWLGWFDVNAVRRVLKLPKDAQADAIISVGYPAEPLPAVTNRKFLSEICEFR